MTSQKNKRGFTLIELLVASTIIVVLASIGIVSFVNAGKSARDGKRKADLETVRAALVLYKVDSGVGYPVGTDYSTMVTALSGAGYISSPVPHDPKYPDRDYGYNGSANTFTLSTTLEKDGSTYSLRNP